jgi:hypothetical protein
VDGDHRVDLRVQDSPYSVGETLAAACRRWVDVGAHDPHAGDLGDGGAEQVLDAGGQGGQTGSCRVVSRRCIVVAESGG